MKTSKHRKPGIRLLIITLALVQVCLADGLAPGDPEELAPLGLTVIAWLILLAAALAGLHLIRCYHDLLPHL